MNTANSYQGDPKMGEPWYPVCLREIDDALGRGRRLKNSREADFLKAVRDAVDMGLFLSEKKESWLRDIRDRMIHVKKFDRFA